jgi:four helix bundle protein
MKDFRSLKVWEKAHLLALAGYRVTMKFPREEMYGLTSQLRRACTSVPTNIAEGCGRGSDAEFGRFLQIAMGSASETESLCLLAKDLAYLATDECAGLQQQVEEVKRMLAALLKSIEAER